MSGNGDAGKNGKALARMAAAALAAAALAACGGGGGGGGLRPDPPPLAPPPPPPPAGPPVVETPDPAYSRHLAGINAGPAHDAGFTGAGIRIGFVDSGVNSSHPAFGDRVVSNLVYLDPGQNDLSVDDVIGHGTAVAQAAAGGAFGQWPGGVAPGAEIVSARIIGDDPPEDDGSGEGNEVDGPIGIAGIHQDLIARDVRIMNNSWGGLYWTNPNATAGIASEYRPFIVDHGGLVVFATGNSGFADPSDMAALPSQPGPGGTMPAADLERGWIAVAALADGSSFELADYSNACGIAMHYCMVAPGTVVVTGTDDAPDAPEYWQWSGTSLAAPLVSGAAALVWEAFPYFDNDMVRQTLLGTATDLGAEGVDEVFGYGRLDVGKAVLGPSQFDWGDAVADFDGFTSVWGNRISGEGGLVKRGSGRLELSHPLSYLGDTRIEGGTLAPVFDLPGNAIVGAGGSLELHDSGVGGNLENRGRVVVTGDAPQHVTGNYVQVGGSTLSMYLGSLVVVHGQARIEGGELEIGGVVDGYVQSEQATLLHAMGGLSGSFDDLVEGPGVFLDATLSYSDTQVNIAVERLDVSAAAAAFAAITPAALSAAERVEKAFREIDRQQGEAGSAVGDDFIRIAGELQRIDTQAGAAQALSSLSGELHAAAVGMTLDTIDMGRRALSSRFDAFDGSVHGAGAWKRALGNGGPGGFAGNGFALDGWLIGRDQDLGSGAAAGFAFGETRAHGRVDGLGDRGHDRQTMGMAYAGWLRGDAYLLGQAGTGRFQRDIERRLFAGEGMASVSSRYAGEYTAASVEAGYRLDVAGFALTPYVGAEHTRLRSDGFSEGGANGFGLRSEGWDARRSQAITGLRMEGEWQGLLLHGYGEWQETLASSGFDLAASFVGVDAWAPLAGQSPTRSGGLFGVGVQAWLGRNALLGLGYDQRFGPRGDERMVSLRYSLGF